MYLEVLFYLCKEITFSLEFEKLFRRLEKVETLQIEKFLPISKNVELEI